MVDSLEMLGGMEPQPGRKAKIPGLITWKWERRWVRGERLSSFPSLPPANAAVLPFAASCAGQDCCSPPGSRLPGSHRERPHACAQPRAHAAPSTWNALCFCGLGNSWSSQQTPALRSPHPRSLSGLNFFENPTPTLLWATSGFATLTLLHCD